MISSVYGKKYNLEHMNAWYRETGMSNFCSIEYSMCWSKNYVVLCLLACIKLITQRESELRMKLITPRCARAQDRTCARAFSR